MLKGTVSLVPAVIFYGAHVEELPLWGEETSYRVSSAFSLNGWKEP